MRLRARGVVLRKARSQFEPCRWLVGRFGWEVIRRTVPELLSSASLDNQGVLPSAGTIHCALATPSLLWGGTQRASSRAEVGELFQNFIDHGPGRS